MRSHRSRLVIALPIVLAACTVWIRHPEYYASQVVELVDAQGEAITTCYDKVLEAQPEAQGQVVVSFAVVKKTGKFERIEVEADTTAPPALTKCVLDSLGTMSLEPPDRADGLLTLVWRFKLGKPRAEVTAVEATPTEPTSEETPSEPSEPPSEGGEVESGEETTSSPPAG